MSLQSVYRGQSVQAEVFFYDPETGAPAVPDAPASFKILTHDSQLVQSGAAIQDTLDPARWYCTFVIPDSAPISDDGRKYKIVWSLVSDNGFHSSVEQFSVQLEFEPIGEDLDVLMLEGGRLKDSLGLSSAATELFCRVLDENGTVVIPSTAVPLSPKSANGLVYYEFDSGSDMPQLVSRDGAAPYFIEWSYTAAPLPKSTEIHVLYVVSPKMYMFIDGVRKFVDVANNSDINPNLRYTDTRLAHHVLAGLQRINSEPPTLTNWSVNKVPTSFYNYVTKAAIVDALRSQYLAEGMTAFDFQGQAVQLNVDRTQYLQTMADNLDQELNDKVPRAKRTYIRASGAGGVLGINVNQSTNHLDLRSKIDNFRRLYKF